MSNYRRTAPWPYDLKIAGVGMMLKPDPQTGVLMGSPKVQPFDQVAPQSYSYSAIPPFDEQAYEFRRLIMGMGERRQQFPIIRRYLFSDGIDASINGEVMLAPEFTTVTPTSTGPIRGFVEAISGGTLKLFALAGPYVLIRNGDTAASWFPSTNVGAGTVQSAVRFKDAGPAPTDALYVTTDDGRMLRFSGSVWTDITASLSATAADQTASWLETSGKVLYRAFGTNRVSTCTADPADPASWSGDVFVGDASHPITWLRMLSDTVFIFKDNGIFTIDATGEDHELFPALRVTPDPTNGRNAAVWLNLMYLRYGDAFYSLGPNTSGVIEMHPVGPERFIENDSPVKGPIVCSAGWNNWFNFMGMYNAETNTSFLLKFGSWFVDDQPPLGSSAFVRSSAVFNPLSAGGSFLEPVIHGALNSFPGKQITAMTVSSLPGPNQRLYLGFDDGSISWCILPRGSPNPLSDPDCRFVRQGTLQYGSHVMNFPANYKSFRGVTVFGPRLDSANVAQIDYRLAPTADWSTLGEFQTPGGRLNFPDGTAGVGIDLRLMLTGDGTGTPFVEGFALHETLRPDLLLERDFTVLARDRMPRRDAANDWRSAEQIRQVLQSAANAKGIVQAVLPDGVPAALEVVDYAEALANDQNRFGMAWDVTLKAIEFKTLVQFGTIGRLRGRSIGSLAGVQVVEMEGL